MNKPEGMIPREDFFAWLREGTEPLQYVGKTKSCTTFFKLPHAENAIYLFSATQYTGTNIRWKSNFEFCGVYFPETQTLRLAEFDLARAVAHLEADEMQSLEYWRGRISERVKERIEQKIANDQNNLSIRTLSEPKNLQRFWNFDEYGAWKQAEDIFLQGDVPDTEYHSFYNLQTFPDDYQEDAIVAYFQNADSFLEAEAKKYIDTHEEEILLTFLENDVLLEKYEALEQDTDSDFSRQREITIAIKAANAKTVLVTVEKDGRELTFRASARDVMYGGGKYSPNSIISESDHRKYEELFGRHTEFCVQDITRITYGRNVLYEAPQDQAEEMNAGMTMA